MLKIFFVFLANCFNVLIIFLKNSKPFGYLSSLGYFSHNLKTLFLKILWIPNSLTSLTNFSFSLNLLNTCPWWNATLIIPFFFVLMISSYLLITSAAFSSSRISSASLFKSSNSTTSSMIIDSNNYSFISSFDGRFVFLLPATPFHIYKQKIITIVQI